MEPYQSLCEEIVLTARAAYAQRLFSGTSGNLSARADASHMLITPTSIRYESLSPEDIVLMKLDGSEISGRLAPSSEWRMHAEVYRAYPGIGAVFHTHSPYATAYAVVHKPIPETLIESRLFLGGELPCAPYAVPGTRAVGLSALPFLSEHGGCLLGNHGVLAVGETIAEARLRAEYIEDAAHINYLAQTLGIPAVLPDP